jgi:hypothetical protein
LSALVSAVGAGTGPFAAAVASSSAVPRERAALGRAFAARAGDCTRIIEELEAAAGIQERSDKLTSRRRRTRTMASRMVARWLISVSHPAWLRSPTSASWVSSRSAKGSPSPT